MASQTIVVRGYKELLRASKDAGTGIRKEVRVAFGEAGEIVRAGAAQELSGYSAKSAAGLKVRVRQRGVAVEQSLRKTTGPRARRNFPGIQMHILSSELQKDAPLVEEALERALDEVGAIFNR